MHSGSNVHRTAFWETTAASPHAAGGGGGVVGGVCGGGGGGPVGGGGGGGGTPPPPAAPADVRRAQTCAAALSRHDNPQRPHPPARLRRLAGRALGRASRGAGRA